MADIARTSIVSKDSPRGLLKDDGIKNDPSEGTDNLTECSVVSNHTNNCSNQGPLYGDKVEEEEEEEEEDFQEIDSFSELSFHATDEVSLQDILESEFAARISSINKSHDSFDDLFENYYKGELKGADNLCPRACKSKDFTGSVDRVKIDNRSSGGDGDDVDIDVDVDNVKCHVVTGNLDDFISGPMQGDTSLITDYLDEYLEQQQQEEEEEANRINHKTTKSVNIFKLNGPEEMPMLTNFDPFTAIEEEDSDCSNSVANSNVLNSPDEFSFPCSPDEGGSNKFGEGQGETTGTSPSVVEALENENGVSEVNRTDGAVRELFTKRVSDDNLDNLTGQNCMENENESKLKVKDSVRPMGSVDTLGNVTDLLKPAENVEVDEFFSSEDIFKVDENVIEVAKVDHGGEEREGEGEEGFRKAQAKEECDDEMAMATSVFGEIEEERWTTVGEILKAQPETFDLDGDPDSLIVVDPAKVESVNSSDTSSLANNTNSTLAVSTLFANGLSESDSEIESSEKKAVKKKKSKKGKKSDEKENISVESSECKTVDSSSVLEDSDDLSNVSVKNLMLTYSSEAPRSFQNRCWYSKGSQPVAVQNLKARSMVDLTYNSKKVADLRSNLFENSKNLETSRSTTNLFGGERHPIITGVSVQALKRRYRNIVSLNVKAVNEAETSAKQRKKMCVPWSEALKSSFSKFDQLSKKTILHVRSVDASKVQKQFNEASTGGSEATCTCKSCGKQVFQMEQIKAEKSVWHKNCFRCKECNKQLSVDTYSSNEGIVYCKPHFRELFKPKAVLEDDAESVKIKKPELIIRENQPIELPPEVVRASDKPDLGLEELASLNVKSRYQVFEKADETNSGPLEKSSSSISVKRSSSILSKLAKFQKKGIDVGVRDEDLNGLPLEQSSTSSEEEEDEEDDVSSKKVVKSKKVKERPMSFSKMGDVKSVWESGVAKTREEMREERKAEIHQIRSKLFMGKQVKMKEAYEQAVRESENQCPRKSIEVRSEKAKSIKEYFEKGEPHNIDNNGDAFDGDGEKKKIVEDDMSLFEAGISKKSRSLFLELDKSAKTQAASNIVKKVRPVSPNATPRSQEMSDNIVKSSDAIEDVQIETADISSKFKFFETYKEPEREKKKFRITPPREGQVKDESPEKEIDRDPNVVRASDKLENEIIRTNTTAKMLSLFRQMEEKTDEIPEGPKPLKCFTPPPDYKGETSETESGESGSEVEEEEAEEEEVEGRGGGDQQQINPNIIRASDKVEDEYLKQAANAARAKQLRAKFEKWEEKEKEKERGETLQRKLNGFDNTNGMNTENSENVEVTSIECTKSLRARFESMKSESDQPTKKIVRPKINRFVEIQNNMAELCDVCKGRVYQLEKVETSGKIFHRACFRCRQCNCLLRMETFTLNCGKLYCLPHFKQKFISKGNYDEGFGVDQHKAKWPTVTSF